MKPATRGRWAEQAVWRFLEVRGYTILQRNVRLQKGELDVVATKDDRLWFIETKSRGRRDRGAPHLAVNRRKRRALYAAAIEFVKRLRYRGDYGFLIASVLPDPQTGDPQISLQRCTLFPPGPWEQRD